MWKRENEPAPQPPPPPAPAVRPRHHPKRPPEPAEPQHWKLPEVASMAHAERDDIPSALYVPGGGVAMPALLSPQHCSILSLRRTMQPVELLVAKSSAAQVGTAETLPAPSVRITRDVELVAA